MIYLWTDPYSIDAVAIKSSDLHMPEPMGETHLVRIDNDRVEDMQGPILGGTKMLFPIFSVSAMILQFLTLQMLFTSCTPQPVTPISSQTKTSVKNTLSVVATFSHHDLNRMSAVGSRLSLTENGVSLITYAYAAR